MSRQVLAVESRRLLVQRLGSVLWSDLSDADRAVAELSRGGVAPKWAASWQASKPRQGIHSAASAAVLTA
jgi:hypothetical protein